MSDFKKGDHVNVLSGELAHGIPSIPGAGTVTLVTKDGKYGIDMEKDGRLVQQIVPSELVTRFARSSDDAADDFVDKANRIVEDIVDRARPIDDVVEGMMATEDRQTVRTLERVVRVSHTRTEDLPTMMFVLTADKEAVIKDGVPEYDLTIGSYTNLDKVSSRARFRVKAELGLPIFCHIEWLREEPESGYSAPARIEGETPNGVASSIVLTWDSKAPARASYRDPANITRSGVYLLNPESEDGLKMMYPGAVLSVHEGAKVVAKVSLSRT